MGRSLARQYASVVVFSSRAGPYPASERLRQDFERLESSAKAHGWDDHGWDDNAAVTIDLPRSYLELSDFKKVGDLQLGQCMTSHSAFTRAGRKPGRLPHIAILTLLAVQHLPAHNLLPPPT